MRVTEQGHFWFDTEDEVVQATRLCRAIHIQGFVNTGNHFWTEWIKSDFGKKVDLDHIIVLAWSTIFLQRLMWSLVCFHNGTDAE